VCVTIYSGINYALIERLVVHVCSSAPFQVKLSGEQEGVLGGILVFLTGVGEVAKLCSILSEHPKLSDPSKVNGSTVFGEFAKISVRSSLCCA